MAPLLVLAMVGLLSAQAVAAWPPERPAGDTPTPEQLAWQDMELGMFCHFGTNTFTDREWGDGTASPEVFNPEQFNPHQWAAAAREAGFKYLILTAKHHDGFCLWPTQQTDYCVRKSKWRDGKGDVVKEVAEACREAGLKLGLYLSPWDRHEPRYADNEAYDRFYMAQMTELLTNYGDILEFWCDGAGGQGHVYNWIAYRQTLNRLQPRCLLAIAGIPDIKWVGNEDGFAPDPLWNVVDVGGKDYWWPAECDARIRQNWFWHPKDANTLKSVEYLLKMYHGSVGRGAGLLLNVAPDDRGLLPEQDVQRLREFRQALDSIYGTDLAAGKSVTVSSAQSGQPASAVVDGDAATYWLAAADNPQAWIEIDLGQPTTFDRVVSMEAIQRGQRIRKYAIDLWDGTDWHRLHEGTSIGHKKIDLLPKPVTGGKVRLVFEATTGPGLRSVGVYLAPQQYWQ